MKIQSAVYEYIRDTQDSPMLSCPNDNRTFYKHFHRQMEILYGVGGSTEIHINNNVYYLRKNEVAICDSFDAHEIIFNDVDNLTINLIIPYSIMEEYNDAKNTRILTSNYITDAAICKKIKTLIDPLYAFWTPDPHAPNQNGITHRLNPVTIHICKAILALFVKEIGFKKAKNQISECLQPNILKFVSENINDVSLEKTAEFFGYSKYYFSKLFYRTFKIHFNDFVKIQRIQNAIILLKQKKISILDAALSVGFNCEATFYRFINKTFNITPKSLFENNADDTINILKLD